MHRHSARSFRLSCFRRRKLALAEAANLPSILSVGAGDPENEAGLRLAPHVFLLLTARRGPLGPGVHDQLSFERVYYHRPPRDLPAQLLQCPDAALPKSRFYTANLQYRESQYN